MTPVTHRDDGHATLAPSIDRFYLVDGIVQQTEEGNDWQRWKIRMYNQLARQFERPQLSALEQYMKRSFKEKRCIDCGDSCGPDHFMESILIKSVQGYYSCPECMASYD